ncbi:MAG: molecular chaperone DnaJ, partial [Spirochaetales bacterium]|nr:molecular chaperone DnaJ [Spirochaetales bacterium]
MPWLGKLLGGTLGFFLGGPLGMIAGAVFGHMMIDRAAEGSSEDGNPNGRFYFVNTGYNRSQMVFFVGAFSMLAKLASADGQVSDAARRKINEFMVNDL